VTAANLTQNQGAIRWWLANSKSKGIIVHGKLTPGAGITYRQASESTVDSTVILTALLRRAAAPGGYQIVTSFPGI
jgi:hypothetical protein